MVSCPKSEEGARGRVGGDLQTKQYRCTKCLELEVLMGLQSYREATPSEGGFQTYSREEEGSSPPAGYQSSLRLLSRSGLRFWIGLRSSSPKQVAVWYSP